MSAERQAMDLLAEVVAAANLGAVDGDDGFVESYNVPVGPIHKAIPFLAEQGIVVTSDGQVRVSTQIRDHEFLPVLGHPDDDECTHRSDGTDATYCGEPKGAHL